MPTVVQFRRGTTAQNNNFTGAAGELSVDTDLEVIRVHDGATVGGFALAGVTASQTLTNKVYQGSSASLTGSVTAASLVGTTHTGTTASLSGNVTGGNILTGGLISATGAITGAAITGSSLTVSTGTVTCGNIVNSNANGTGNIGSASVYYNTVFAKATSAQYADVAELYSADQEYPVGTVLVFGGEKEVTQSTSGHMTSIAGTVSDNPAYIMNAGIDAEFKATVALLGRVPVRVIGKIKPGDLIVSSGIPGVGMAAHIDKYLPGCVIGKALESFSSDVEGIIEVVVGRL